MNKTEEWHTQIIAETTCTALKANGFDTHYAKTRHDALSYLESILIPGMTVGMGGSMTLSELGISALLENHNVTILDHSRKDLSREQKMEIMRAQLTSDLFLASANAITISGEIFNIDGNGNRIAALTFGPKKTIVFAGINKIVRNLDEAESRCKMIASPMNNKRLDKPNPCTKTGICVDCHTDTRICRIYSVLKRRPSSSDYTVVIIGEKLGY